MIKRVTVGGAGEAAARLESAGLSAASAVMVLREARNWMRTSLTDDGWQHHAYAFQAVVSAGKRAVPFTPVATVRFTGASGLYVVTTGDF
jgi:hypothetical protein